MCSKRKGLVGWSRCAPGCPRGQRHSLRISIEIESWISDQSPLNIFCNSRVTRKDKERERERESYPQVRWYYSYTSCFCCCRRTFGSVDLTNKEDWMEERERERERERDGQGGWNQVKPGDTRTNPVKRASWLATFQHIAYSTSHELGKEIETNGALFDGSVVGQRNCKGTQAV